MSSKRHIRLYPKSRNAQRVLWNLLWIELLANLLLPYHNYENRFNLMRQESQLCKPRLCLPGSQGHYNMQEDEMIEENKEWSYLFILSAKEER